VSVVIGSEGFDVHDVDVIESGSDVEVFKLGKFGVDLLEDDMDVFESGSDVEVFKLDQVGVNLFEDELAIVFVLITKSGSDLGVVVVVVAVVFSLVSFLAFARIIFPGLSDEESFSRDIPGFHSNALLRALWLPNEIPSEFVLGVVAVIDLIRVGDLGEMLSGLDMFGEFPVT